MTETGALACAVLGRDPEPEEVALVHSVTGGNPLYVIEAVRETLASLGDEVQASDLAGVLERRLGRLSAEARTVAEVAAAVGRDFGLELVTEACDLDADTVVRSIDELWRLRILNQRDHRYDVRARPAPPTRRTTC